MQSLSLHSQQIDNQSKQYQAALESYQAALAALRFDDVTTADALRAAMTELEQAHQARMNGGKS